MNKYDTAFFLHLIEVAQGEKEGKHCDYGYCNCLSDSSCLVDDRAHKHIE